MINIGYGNIVSEQRIIAILVGDAPLRSPFDNISS